jgi:hypothetical protein
MLVYKQQLLFALTATSYLFRGLLWSRPPLHLSFIIRFGFLNSLLLHKNIFSSVCFHLYYFTLLDFLFFDNIILSKIYSPATSNIPYVNNLWISEVQQSRHKSNHSPQFSVEFENTSTPHAGSWYPHWQLNPFTDFYWLYPANVPSKVLFHLAICRCYSFEKFQ